MRFLTETGREGESLSFGMARLLSESLIFFLAVRMSLLSLRGESSKLPPVLKLRRAGKAQSFGFLLTTFFSQAIK